MKEQYTYYIVPTLWHLWPSEPTLLPTNLPSLIQYNMATSCAASQTLPASLKKVVPVRRRSQGSLPYRPRLIPVYPTPRSHLPPTPGHYNKPRFYPSYIYQTSLCTTKRAASTTTPLKSKIRTLYPLQPSWSMSISTPLLASLQPLQTRHHIQESPSFCKPQGYLLPSQGNPKAQFLATPTTPQGSYSILLHPPQDSYTSSAKPALPAASPLFNPAVPACALYSPVHVPTRRPAYTCLHLPTPTCLPACRPLTKS